MFVLRGAWRMVGGLQAVGLVCLTGWDLGRSLCWASSNVGSMPTSTSVAWRPQHKLGACLGCRGRQPDWKSSSGAYTIH